MAHYTGPSCRYCRREGMKLFLKGERCMTDKCAIERRAYPPGMHGQAGRRAKVSEFGTQLREKQKVRRVYGLMERQFRTTFDRAVQKKGAVTSAAFFAALELRLDNVVYRMGFARSRNEARQLVRHNHILVNGSRVNIPSYRGKVGDEVSIVAGSHTHSALAGGAELYGRRMPLPWIAVDHARWSGKITAQPTRDDIQIPVKERLIVELYSK